MEGHYQEFREIGATDRQIDQLVYELYGLCGPVGSLIFTIGSQSGHIRIEPPVGRPEIRAWFGENCLKMGFSDGYGGLI